MRPKTLSAVVILFVLLTALTCFSQQTDVTQFAAFGGYSYLSTPSLNLTQRGFDSAVSTARFRRPLQFFHPNI
jgi:hypothetical protein